MVSILTALLMIPLAAFAGAAMDYARLLSAHTALQGAVDAAALQAGGMLRDSDDDRKAAAQKVYDAQMATYSGAIDHRMEIDFNGGNGRVNASAWIDIPTVLLKVIGKEQLRASVASTITARQDQVNMSLVLDVTGSLSDADLKAIKVAAKDLVDIVLAPNQQTDHFISLVPFAQFVNIGTGSAAESVLDKKGLSKNSGKLIRGKQIAKHLNGCDAATGAAREEIIRKNFEKLRDIATPYALALWERSQDYTMRLAESMTVEGQRAIKSPLDCIIRNPTIISQWEMLKVYDVPWSGCVEARPAPYDVQNTVPNQGSPDTLFVPFFQYDGKFLASKPERYPDYIKDVTFDKNNETDGKYKYFNLEGKIEDFDVGLDFSIFKYLGDNSFLHDSVVRFHADSICPPEVTPLTHASSTLKTNIDKLVHVRAGGTNIGEGLAWGWRSISGTAPFAFPDGIAAANMRKRVLVVMTDGENNVNDTNGWGNTPFKTQYTPYGHAGAGHIANVSNKTQANNHFNLRMKEVCTNAKAEGIEVYTVLFRSTSANVWSLLQQCATGSNHAFKAANSAALSQTFRTIAQRMSSLYISN